MKQQLYDALSDNPIIMAIKDKEGLQACMKLHDETVVFVLYGEVATIAEITDMMNLTGKKAVYNIAIPKGDEHVWEDQKVEFFDSVWQVIGFPKRGVDANLPLDWNDIWMVAKYE